MSRNLDPLALPAIAALERDPVISHRAGRRVQKCFADSVQALGCGLGQTRPHPCWVEFAVAAHRHGDDQLRRRHDQRIGRRLCGAATRQTLLHDLCAVLVGEAAVVDSELGTLATVRSRG
jgi:hypothetical protein